MRLQKISPGIHSCGFGAAFCYLDAEITKGYAYAIGNRLISNLTPGAAARFGQGQVQRPARLTTKILSPHQVMPDWADSFIFMLRCGIFAFDPKLARVYLKMRLLSHYLR